MKLSTKSETTQHKLHESRSWGILDWGIGGLGFYRLFKEKHPETKVVYFSDAGATPYGRLSTPQLAARVQRVIHELYTARGVSHLVVACNAASTVLPMLVANGAAIPAALQITGIIEHGIEIVRRAPEQIVGIVGGRRTVLSGAYRRALSDNRRQIKQRIAQPLSAYIEAGDTDSPAFLRDLERIMQPLRSAPALLLACTHYAAIMPHFRRILPHTRILDPVEEMLTWIEEHWRLPRTQGEDVFLTTGDPQAMTFAAHKAFAVAIKKVGTIDLK